MRSMNKVFLLGHLGQDPERRLTKNGRPFVRLSMATNKSWKDKDEDGKYVERTDWHNVYVYGSQADACANQLRSGSLVMVEGELTVYEKTEIEQVEGSQDSHLPSSGTKRVCINAQFVRFFGQPKARRSPFQVDGTASTAHSSAILTPIA